MSGLWLLILHECVCKYRSRGVRNLPFVVVVWMILLIVGETEEVCNCLFSTCLLDLYLAMTVDYRCLVLLHLRLYVLYTIIQMKTRLKDFGWQYVGSGNPVGSFDASSQCLLFRVAHQANFTNQFYCYDVTVSSRKSFRGYVRLSIFSLILFVSFVYYYLLLFFFVFITQS